MRNKPLNIAVIGCGRWGPNHIRMLQSDPACLVTVVDSDKKRLDEIVRTFPSVRVESNVDGVWNDPEIEAVVIATPTVTHYDLVRKSIEAGKHVLCEKPLCSQYEQAAKLVQLAEQRGVVLMTGHIFLFNPGIRRIKELFRAGELGDLHYLSSVRTNWGPIRSDVNAAFDLASHDIAIYNWLLDAVPRSVSATGGDYVQPGIHDVVFITMTYPSGVIAQVHASWLNPQKVRQMTIIGSRRMVTWNDLDTAAPVAVHDRGVQFARDADALGGEKTRSSTGDGEVWFPKVDASEPLKLQGLSFLDAIARGKAELCDGRFALDVMRTLDAVDRSLAEKGHPVAVRV